MAAITQANAGYVSDETVSVFAFDKFAQATPVMPAIYNQQGSSTYREVEGSMSGLDDFQEKTELADPSEDRPIQQFKKEFLHREFALMVKVDRKVYEDERFTFFSRLGSKIGESGIRTFEKQAAAPLNEAFASSTYLTEDGLTLCNAAHLNSDGGNSQSNSGTTALSYDAVGTTEVAMLGYKGYRGETIQMKPDLIIHPDALAQTAFEIIKSRGNPNEANLKENYFSGRLASLSWSYLDRNDTNNWFMADSMLMKENMIWYWRMVLEIFGDGDAFKGMRRIGGYYRSSHSSVDWRWVYGHNVT